MALTDARANVAVLTSDQVTPESLDLRNPAPACVHPPKLASPVPAYTTVGGEGAKTATTAGTQLRTKQPITRSLPVICPLQRREIKFLHLEKCPGDSSQSLGILILHHFVHDARYDLP